MTNELTDSWRRHIEDALADGRRRFDALEARANKIEAAMNENTQLTRQAVDVSQSTERKVDAMRSEVQPVTDAMKTMEAGIRTMGRLGDAGAKIGKGVVVFGGFWIAVKLVFSGASWSEIYAAFLRAIGR
jgi:hypothetical protein